MRYNFFIIIIFLFFINSKNNYSQKNSIHIKDLWGVTLNNVDNSTDISEIQNSIRSFYCNCCVRFVFDVDSANPYKPNPRDYNRVVPNIDQNSNIQIMGLVLDSWDWAWPPWNDSSCGKIGEGYYFDYDKVYNRIKVFINNDNLWNHVDIWEVGNEVNAPWVYGGDIESTMRTLHDGLVLIKSKQPGNIVPKTSITLDYFPYPSCVGSCAIGNQRDFLMNKWAVRFLSKYPDVVNLLDYVFVSYYEVEDSSDNCSRNNVDWQTVFTELSHLFPHSQVGFGEVGCGKPGNACSDTDKITIINNYYNYPSGNWGLPYVRACFYWYYQQDCVPNYTNNNIWIAINNIMQNSCAGNQKLDIMNNISNEQSFDLLQNYPNPFNPTTKISFQIPISESISLKVYDMLGNEVAVLINNEVKDAGKYDISFDGTNFASGMYFYKLDAGSFSETKKMILIK